MALSYSGLRAALRAVGLEYAPAGAVLLACRQAGCVVFRAIGAAWRPKTPKDRWARPRVGWQGRRARAGLSALRAALRAVALRDASLRLGVTPAEPENAASVPVGTPSGVVSPLYTDTIDDV